MSCSPVPQESLRTSLRWVDVGSVKNALVWKNKTQPTFTVRKVTPQSCEKVKQQDLIGELILEKAQWDVYSHSKIIFKKSDLDNSIS